MRRAAIGFFVLCAALFLAPGETRGANYYNPCSRVSLTSTAADTPSAITTTFGVGLEPATCAPFSSAKDGPPEWIFASVIDFTPPGWNVATDAQIPDGEKVGEFKSKDVLALFDNGCNLVLNLNLDLLDGTIDVTDPVAPLPNGTPDRLNPLSVKNVDGVPAAAEKWPAYLDTLADQTGMDLSRLRARFVGVNTSSIPGTTIVWNFLVFEPGARIAYGIYPEVELGYPTVSILQDPTSNGSSNDPVTDFCAPFRSEYTLYDTVAGQPYRRNSGDGVYYFTTYSAPMPDADNDGIENRLDPCPYNPNASGWDPRGVLISDQTPGDNDIDGLPDECDPNLSERSPCNSDQGASGHDQDCDGWANRIDNCPLVSNDDQADTDGDRIGDACDQHVTQTDGWHGSVCTVAAVTIGAGGSSPRDPQTMSPCSVDGCLGYCGEFSSDADCDTDTDVFDLLAELQFLAQLSTPECVDDAYHGCNGILDMPDIFVLLRYLAGVVGTTPNQPIFIVLGLCALP